MLSPDARAVKPTAVLPTDSPRAVRVEARSAWRVAERGFDLPAEALRARASLGLEHARVEGVDARPLAIGCDAVHQVGDAGGPAAGLKDCVEKGGTLNS